MLALELPGLSKESEEIQVSIQLFPSLRESLVPGQHRLILMLGGSSLSSVGC